ncbi:MAG: hypothetical protein Q9195_002802 [Heterodermia aff. obscurata]
MQQRWRDTHRSYFDGLLDQVKHTSQGQTFTRSVDEFMDMRRRTIGVNPAITLTDVNDVVSYKKDVVNLRYSKACRRSAFHILMVLPQALGVDHNLITLVQRQGGTVQDGVDKVGEIIENCYKQWYAALAKMPIWGEGIDREVLRFLDCCRNIPLGNVHWR